MTDGRVSKHSHPIRRCENCGGEIHRPNPRAIFCSDACRKRKHYANSDGEWRRFFRSLIAQKRDRQTLAVDDLMNLLRAQDHRCALSGVELTCKRPGHHGTNASLDRKVAGGAYALDNVQLVCTALNTFRGATGLQDFIWWCRQVTAFNKE